MSSEYTSPFKKPGPAGQHKAMYDALEGKLCACGETKYRRSDHKCEHCMAMDQPALSAECPVCQLPQSYSSDVRCPSCQQAYDACSRGN